MRIAREVQAERLFEMGWQIAEGLTGEDAYAGHVKLTQLRWRAGKMAPRRYGSLKAVEPGGGKDGSLTMVLKRYGDAPVEQLGRPLEAGESFVLRRQPIAGNEDEREEDDGW